MRCRNVASAPVRAPLRATLVPVEVPVRPLGTRPPVADVHVLRGRRVVNLFVRLFPIVLAGYALFDRTYAWLHLPGIPLFQGELMVGLALIVFAAATHTILPGLKNRFPSTLLLAFMLWGLLRTVPYVGTYHIDAVRDAALWYYAVFGIVVAGLVVSMPHLPKLWAGSYGRLLPWLLLWSIPAKIGRASCRERV